MIKVCLGAEADTAHHIHLVNIFLESAAINVPISICAAIGIAMGKLWGDIVSMPGLASQVRLSSNFVWNYDVLLSGSASGVGISVDHSTGRSREGIFQTTTA
jgi:hypothetical protein